MINYNRRLMHFRSLESHHTCRSPHRIHTFGTSFSPSNKKQCFFSQSICKSDSSSCSDLLKENQVLRHEVCAIRETLVRILMVEGYGEEQASVEETAQLLEEVIMLILRRSEEINRLKQELSSHIIDAQRGFYSSSGRQTLRKSANASMFSLRSHNSSPADASSEEDSSHYISQIPIHRVLNISKYQPKALLSIGKEVKTINRLSSNHLLKKQSHSSSLSSSVQSSLRQLLHLKNKSRLSIDKSIYLPEEGELTERTERYCISKQVMDENQILSYHKFTANNLPTGMHELTPIKEERFSKYSEMETSKINFYKAERFTFESTTSDPQSYANRTE